MTVLHDIMAAPQSEVQAMPTVRTWNILIHCYSRHGLAYSAEEIMTMMRRHGSEPNQVSWNSLVKGYAKQVDAEGTIAVLKRMQDSGCAGNERTVQQLGGYDMTEFRERVFKELMPGKVGAS
jgi:pentatricopeptide repeat protein